MEETIKLLREWNVESSRENYLRRINEATEKGVEKGREEGIVKGIIKGRQEGIVEGLIKGKEEGIATSSLNIAQKLISKQLSKEFVIEVTGISEKDYDKLVSHKK